MSEYPARRDVLRLLLAGALGLFGAVATRLAGGSGVPGTAGEPPVVPYDLSVCNNAPAPRTVHVSLLDGADRRLFEQSLPLEGHTDPERPADAPTTYRGRIDAAGQGVVRLRARLPDGRVATTPIRLAEGGVAATEAALVTVTPAGELAAETVVA